MNRFLLKTQMIIFKKLKKYEFDLVINGSDQEYTVNLSKKLKSIFTPSLVNSNETYEILSSKYLQQEKLKENGLPNIQQCLISMNNLTEGLKRCENLDFPVFAKPANGVCSIGAFKADNIELLKLNLLKVPKIINFGNVDEYLIQEYVSGHEIIVDTFSIKGIHKICSIQRYHKENIYGIPVYRSIEIFNDEDNKVQNYVLDMLEIYNFKYGFCHIELFFN